MSQDYPTVRWALLKSEDTLFTWLTEGDLRHMLENAADYIPVKWLSAVKLEQEADPAYWKHNERMLLRVEIVVPKPKTTVMEWVIPYPLSGEGR